MCYTSRIMPRGGYMFVCLCWAGIIALFKMGAVSAGPEDGKNYTYMGCFYNTNWTLSGLDLMVVTKRIKNNNAQCGYICYDSGFRYAGTQNGTVCMCGNTYGLLGAGGVCNIPCPGYPDEICGGRSSASIYHTEKVCFQRQSDKAFKYIPQPTTKFMKDLNMVVGLQFALQTSEQGCMDECAANPECMHYTYYSSTHWAPSWVNRCFGFTIYADRSKVSHEKGANSGLFTPCFVSESDFPEHNEEYGGHLARTIGFGIMLVIIIAIWMHHENKYEKA